MRMRLMEVPLHLDTYKAFGASTIPLPGGELYTALQLGTVDGCENGIATLYTYKFYEVTKYLSMLPVVSNGAVYLMSKKSWKKLSPEYQKAIIDSVSEALQKGNDEYMRLEKEGLTHIKDADKQVFYPDAGPFIELVKPVAAKYLKDLPPWVQAAYDEMTK